MSLKILIWVGIEVVAAARNRPEDAKDLGTYFNIKLLTSRNTRLTQYPYTATLSL